MKIKLLSLLLFFINPFTFLGQIKLENVSKIVILDYVNWNYESVNSAEYEIDVKNDFTFLKTGNIPKVQFVQEKRKVQLKNLNRKLSKLYNKIHQDKDSLTQKQYSAISSKFWSKIDSAYEKYVEKLKPKKIGKINLKLVESLILALNNHPILADSLFYPLEKWVNNNKKEIKDYLLNEEQQLSPKEIDSLVDSYQYKTIPKLEFLDTMMVTQAYRYYQFNRTSYYPSISITVYTSDNDTLHFDNSSQSDPPLPWVLYKGNERITFFNIEINNILFHILPKNSKINRKRLNSLSIQYDPRKYPLVKSFAEEILYKKKNSR